MVLSEPQDDGPLGRVGQHEADAPLPQRRAPERRDVDALPGADRYIYIYIYVYIYIYI